MVKLYCEYLFVCCIWIIYLSYYKHVLNETPIENYLNVKELLGQYKGDIWGKLINTSYVIFDS